MNSNNAAEEYRRMTETPVPKLITTLALPTIVSMLVTNIYNTADTYFVSRIGTSASGAVGIVFALMALYQAVGFMCGHGSGSFISRLLGMKEDDRAVTYGATAFWMSFLIGVAISAVCFLLTNPLLRMLGSTDTILPYARQYAYWIFLSGPFLTTSCTINNHLRYEGKAFYAMIGLTAGGILNMVGDPILMFGLGLGVSGAGLSTCISQVVSFLILLHMVTSGKTVVRYRPSLAARTFQVYWNIVRVGSPSLARQLLGALSTVFLNRQAKVYGVASFNYGARKYQRVRNSWLFTEVVGTVLLTVLGIITFLFAEPIVAWFRNDPEVVAIGAAALRWASVSCILQQTSVSSNMLLQSTGQSRPALILASLRSGIFFIPLVMILPIFFGVRGIETAQPVADICSAFVSLPVALAFLHSMGKREQTESL